MSGRREKRREKKETENTTKAGKCRYTSPAY